jgi:hypothetical protein
MIYFWFIAIALTMIGGTNGCARKADKLEGATPSYATQQYIQNHGQVNEAVVSSVGPSDQLKYGVFTQMWGQLQDYSDPSNDPAQKKASGKR